MEPVEFIVSGSLTGANNTLQQYPTSGVSNMTTTTQRTVTTRENTAYNNASMDAGQSYAPYFLVSLRDQTVKEGEPVLFEIVISGKDYHH